MADLMAALRHGRHLHESGDWEQAAEAYRQVLIISPEMPQALYCQGLLYYDQGRLNEAIDQLERCVRADSSRAIYHADLALAYQSTTRLREAAASYRKALELKPDFAAAYNNLGNVYRELGEETQAISCFDQALQLDPELAESHSNLAEMRLERRQFAEALASILEALRLRPDSAEIRLMLGDWYAVQKRTSEAAGSYRHALTIKPDLAAAHYKLGTALRSEKQFAEAADCYRETLRLVPESVEALNALAQTLTALKRTDEARGCYARAIEIDPVNIEAHLKLAAIFQNESNYPEAEAHFRFVQSATGDHIEALFGLFSICMNRGLWDDATQYIERILGLWPDNPEAHFFHGTLLLMKGEFAEGWQEFEHRMQCQNRFPRDFTQPLWNGSPAQGKTILVYAEWGFGDALQFLRYAPLVDERAAGAQVLIEVHHDMVPLLKESGFANVVDRGGAVRHFDYQIPLLSLPAVFETSLATIPAQTPYIVANPQRVERWRKRLSGIDGFKVGIHWQGSPAYSNDRQRSIPLTYFKALGQVPGVQLISLQKGMGTEQIAQLSKTFSVIEFADMDDEGGAFMDTAAVMNNLDLVITSDSAVAHLAGAMAVPVWVALGFAPEWRFLLDREDSPWYPSMRLFRQTVLDNWSELFDRIAGELARTIVREPA
jgi:tetratricopeptide (TPR) repeat protein